MANTYPTTTDYVNQTLQNDDGPGILVPAGKGAKDMLDKSKKLSLALKKGGVVTRKGK
jgi:hypothetical protein